MVSAEDTEISEPETETQEQDTPVEPSHSSNDIRDAILDAQKSDEGEAEKVKETDEESEEDDKSDSDKKSEDDKESEESEETGPQDKGPVPYNRFSQVIAERNDLRSRLREIEPEILELRETKNTYDRVKTILEDALSMASWDPTMAAFAQHWLIQGREPREDEIQNPVEYAKYVRSVGERQGRELAEKSATDVSLSVAQQQILDGYNQEEDRLKKDPVFSKLVSDEDHLEQAYGFLHDLFRSVGNDHSRMRIKTLEGALRYLYADEIAKAEREAGRKEATARMNKPKPASIKPGSSARPKTKVDWSKLTQREQIRQAILEAQENA